MSKTALKKELSGYTTEQIIEVVLDLYDSRPEVKDYFNFFLNPDSKKLFEKYQKALDKEFAKSKWNRSKTRISVIKKLIKGFESFHPDIQYRYRLYQYIITLALQYEDRYYYSETLYNGICGIVRNYLILSDSNNELDVALEYTGSRTGYGMPGGRSFKDRISEECQDYVDSKRI